MAEGHIELSAQLSAAGEVLQQVTSTRSTSWDVESGDPAERTARAEERLLELNEASARGIEALVAAAEKESKWVVRTGWLTVVITVLSLGALVVAILALRAV